MQATVIDKKRTIEGNVVSLPYIPEPGKWITQAQVFVAALKNYENGKKITVRRHFC